MNKNYKTPLGVTSQFSFCGLPLRLDTYAGCALSCTYCFARLRGGNANTTKIRIADDKNIIKKFSNAFNQKERSSGIVAELIRNKTPLHFGGMSDPFQPIEKREGVSFRVLRFLNSINYPVVISTKSTLLSDQKYLDLIKQNPNLVVQFSFSTIDDKKSLVVEPHSFAPTEILHTIETLSKNNITTTVRWQPYIPLLSDSPQVFIDRIAGVGVKHVGLEHLKLPVERNSPLWLKLSLKLDFDIKEYYIKHNSFKDGRELILPPDYKLRNALIVRQELRRRNMTFGSADNDIQYLSDNNCCCSGVDQFKGFENWNKFQIAYAIKKSKGKLITFDLISDEWYPKGSIDKYLNSHSRIEKGMNHNSVKEYVLDRWESLNSAFNPTKFYGVEDSGKRDNYGFRIFTWNNKVKNVLCQ